MEFSLQSLFEWTKLVVRDPRVAFGLVKAAALPLNVSVMMIVLAGVVSGVMSGLVEFLVGKQVMTFQFADGQVVSFYTGPLAEGVYAAVIGLTFSYATYLIGRKMGGTGSLADLMSVTAVLQLVMTVVFTGQLIVSLLLPFAGLLVLMLAFYVLLRGIGHAVNVGHEFDSLGKSTLVIMLAFFASIFAISFVFAATGLGPQPIIQGAV